MINFVGGTMFWVKAQIFKDFFSKNDATKIVDTLEIGDVREPSRTHAMERFFGCLVNDKKFRIVRTI
jgi:lipopolysaccharide biosynthesis protein